MSTPPPPIGRIISTPEDPLRAARNGAESVGYPLVVANLTGNPAMSVPLWRNADSVPIGVHFLGRFPARAPGGRAAGRPPDHLSIQRSCYAREMTTPEPPSQPDEYADLWLTSGELASWLSVVRLMTRLPWAIDQQLQRDADLSMVEYMAMAMLADAAEWTMRMSDLAEQASVSLSRLSHLVKRLESRGYVRREPDPVDGRFTNAILLPAGMAKLESAAPGHVAYVRRLVVDNLSAERLRRLGQDAERILQRIDSPAR